MKKVILVLTVLLCFNCSTEEEQNPISVDNLKKTMSLTDKKYQTLATGT